MTSEPAQPERAAGTLRRLVDPRRLDIAIPILIAVASLIGAVVTWRASLAANDGSGLDAQARREVAEEQQIRVQLGAIVANDRRLLASYQEHVLAARRLFAEAETLGDDDPDAAAERTLEAQSRLNLARSLRPLFRAQLPDFGDAQG
ncbi:MAG: hypothetical protein M3295_05440, partial [Chloroflexota bacterium]|nr:hypothetical protein [Chloroflexota bacterium]